MKKYLAITVIGLLIVGAYFALNSRSAQRLQWATSLFSGAEQFENFASVKDTFPTSTMTASTSPFQFGEGEKITLPSTYKFDGDTFSVNQLLEETDTGALFVLHKGEIRFEEYWLSGGREVNWLSMSVAKSFLSATIGIAVEEGLIDIETPITDYCPELKGSAYDEVRIKDILQMSSGANWNEDYSDFDSDINRLGRIMAIGGSLDEFAATLTRAHEPGTVNHYNSTDTQVLGMLLARATGKTVTAYMQEKLWHPLGMESDAYWLLDDMDVEMAFGGLNATARDYAKLGELYRQGGHWQGIQLVPSAWVKASVTPDAPHLMPDANAIAEASFGYGYQWWIPVGDIGEFIAIGVYNQFIYINPSKDLVIVKLSANSSYGTTLDESSYRERETIEFFRAIANVLN